MTAPDASVAVKQPPNDKRKRALKALTVVFCLLGLAWLLLWIFYLQYHQSTDDAYVNGDKIMVTSVVSGTPIAFFADDTDLVQEGQVLVKLDPTEYKILYEKELAALASTVLQVRQLYDQVHANAANVRSQQTNLSKARYDYDNRKKLIDTKAISQEDFIHSRDSYTLAESALKQAVAQYEVALAAAGNTPLEQHPMIEQQKAAVLDAYYKLRHCTILAPTTGYVAQRAVQIGQWVSPSSPLMAVIPLDRMWVDANFKETELTYMRIGQPAKVKFDIYGRHVEFDGSVIGIAFGTGSVFSLIPPQNATGNWIKIVQRLPVRISLDPNLLKTYPLRLGLSAEVNVNVSRTDLPMIAEVPAKKALATTDVFRLNEQEVEKVIAKIIEDNSKPQREPTTP